MVAGRKGSIFNAYVMMECVGPKFWGKVSSEEDGSNRVGDSQVSAFDRSILVGSVCTSRSDVIAVAFKEATHFWIFVEFATLVKVDIFVRAMGGMCFEEISKPVDR